MTEETTTTTHESINFSFWLRNGVSCMKTYLYISRSQHFPWLLKKISAKYLSQTTPFCNLHHFFDLPTVDLLDYRTTQPHHHSTWEMEVSGVALVVGAGSEIGRLVALTLVSRGVDTIVCADRDWEAACRTADECLECIPPGRSTKLRAHGMGVITKDKDSVQAMVDKARSLGGGRIDHCIMTGGGRVSRPFFCTSAACSHLE